MDVQGMSLVLYIYTLDNGQIKVEKVPIRMASLIVVIVSKRRVMMMGYRHSKDIS
jgi:hypothetical protein